jgi:hypothetical protein
MFGPQPINATLPLAKFTVRLIAADVSLVTYVSEATSEGQRGRETEARCGHDMPADGESGFIKARRREVARR